MKMKAKAKKLGANEILMFLVFYEMKDKKAVSRVYTVKMI